MTRKDKLEQTKKLADLWYQQQKNKIYIAQQKERRGVAWRQKSDLSRQAISRIQKIIQEKLYHRNEVLWMNRSEADVLDQFLTEPSEELQKIEPEWEYDEEEDSRGNTLWT